MSISLYICKNYLNGLMFVFWLQFLMGSLNFEKKLNYYYSHFDKIVNLDNLELKKNLTKPNFIHSFKFQIFDWFVNFNRYI